MLSKKLIAIALIGLLLGSSLLAGCAGGARVDVDIDPETGQGTIDIIGVGGEEQQDGGSNRGLGTDFAIVLAIIVALFLAIIALVIALVGRKPRERSD
ncbi:MAG: hypothetical protein KIS85_04080 [Anaerolineales bacterium]|nr:hypothetical protein [Anaerolineales bacterium]